MPLRLFQCRRAADAPEKPPADERAEWRKRRKKVEDTVAEWPVNQIAIFLRSMLMLLPREQSSELLDLVKSRVDA